MSKVRLNLELSEDFAKLLDTIAEEESATRTEIVRRALAVIKAYREQRKVGRTHIGFAASADQLDAEMIGILESTPEPTKRQEPSVAKSA